MKMKTASALCALLVATGAAGQGSAVQQQGTVTAGQIATFTRNGVVQGSNLSSFGLRLPLTSNTTYYVSPSGNDSNLGTSVSPWLTAAHAYTYISQNIDTGPYTATVQFAPGTYAGFQAFGQSVGGPNSLSGIQFLGDPVTPSNVVFNSSIIATYNARIMLSGFRFTTASANCVYASGGGIININGAVDFHGCSQANMQANTDGVIVINSSYTISGPSTTHYLASKASTIEDNATSITLSGTPNFSLAFAVAVDGYVIVTKTNPFTGSGTGTSYSVTSNGVIDTGGQGNIFPGSGTSSTTGGQFDPQTGGGLQTYTAGMLAVGAGVNYSFAPTGSGTVNITPATTGTISNEAINATTLTTSSISTFGDNVTLTKSFNGADSLFVVNPNTGASAQSVIGVKTNTTNSLLQLNLNDSSGSPFGQMKAGSALGFVTFDLPNTFFRDVLGSTQFEIAGTLSATQYVIASGTIGAGGRLTTNGGDLTIAPSSSLANITGNLNVSGLSASLPVYTSGAKTLTNTAPAGYSAVLSGTTASIGGGALGAGACTSGTVSVTGATTSMVATVSPAGNVVTAGAWFDAYVSSANTVTVRVCTAIAQTPTATTYNVRVFQ